MTIPLYFDATIASFYFEHIQILNGRRRLVSAGLGWRDSVQGVAMRAASWTFVWMLVCMTSAFSVAANVSLPHTVPVQWMNLHDGRFSSDVETIGRHQLGSRFHPNRRRAAGALLCDPAVA
jgi:hypothetical protein